MKQLILDYYDIQAIGIIKISDRVYKIKTIQDVFFVKIVDDKNIEKIQEWIDVLHLQCFVHLIKNKDQNILTPYHHQFIYLMNAVDNNKGLMKEMKIKFYFETLAYLHTTSFFYTKINQDYFITLQNDILSIIKEREIYYEQMIQNFESIVYRSPSQWMLVMNYYRISESLCNARQYLSQYISTTNDFTQLRVCLTYKHFDYDHMALKERIFLSIDNMTIDLPIYDLFDMYQRIPDILFDLDCFSQYYFKKVELTQDEKLLLCCLMNIVPIIYYNDDEIENIIKLSRLLYYIDSIHTFVKQI